MDLPPILSLNKIEELNDNGKNPSSFAHFIKASKKLFHVSNSLIFEKLSIIVDRYFENKRELEQYSEEMDTLIKYNKCLIEVLNKFEEQESKLMTRLRRMEEMNLEYMREYCLLKGKQMQIPKAHKYESIFADYNVNSFKFESTVKKKDEDQNSYKDQLFQILRKNYLAPEFEIEKVIKENIDRVLENSTQEHKLKDIHYKVLIYNKAYQEMTDHENTLNLLKLRAELRKDLEDYFVESGNDDIKPDYILEENFINQVTKLHSELEDMDQEAIMTYLKQEKQIRQKLEKQKVKALKVYEEEFARLEIDYTFQREAFQKLKAQNEELHKENKDYKNRREIKKIKSRSRLNESTFTRQMNESNFDLSTITQKPSEEKSAMEKMQAKLLQKMAQVEELKKKQVDNEELSKQLRKLMQENQQLKKEMKKLETSRLEKSAIQNKSQLMNEMREVRDRHPQILARLNVSHDQSKSLHSFGMQTEEVNNQSDILNNTTQTVQINKITSDKAVQSDTLFEIELPSTPKSEGRQVQIQHSKHSIKQSRRRKRQSLESKDDSILLSPSMPAIKDVELLWNNNFESTNDKEKDRTGTKENDAGTELTIRMLESRINEYEKLHKKNEEVIKMKNEEMVRKEEIHKEELQKYLKINDSFTKLEKKQNVIEHLAVVVYNTVSLIGSLGLTQFGCSLKNKIDTIIDSLEELMEDYQITFEKDIFKDMPGNWNDLSLNLGATARKQINEISYLQKAFSQDSSNLDHVKEIVEIFENQTTNNNQKQEADFTTRKLEKKDSLPDKKPTHVYFDAHRRSSDNDEVRGSDSKINSLIKIPKMKGESQELELSCSKRESRKSFQTNSRKIASQNDQDLLLSFNLSSENGENMKKKLSKLASKIGIEEQEEIELFEMKDSPLKFQYGSVTKNENMNNCRNSTEQIKEKKDKKEKKQKKEKKDKNSSTIERDLFHSPSEVDNTGKQKSMLSEKKEGENMMKQVIKNILVREQKVEFRDHDQEREFRDHDQEREYRDHDQEREYRDHDQEREYLELYQRQQQTSKCLEEAEKKLKEYEIRHQKFVQNLFCNEKHRNSKLQVEERIYHLERLVLELKQELEEERKEHNEIYKAFMKESKMSINSELKKMRRQNKDKGSSMPF